MIMQQYQQRWIVSNLNKNIDSETKSKQVQSVIQGVRTSDGAGVKLTRIIGSQQLQMLDPFLLLDCFESNDPNDYIAGFPPHPHRGFETVTYILDGQMRHADSRGNEGVIAAGGVQWMTAGEGILHSEMPEQQQGLLKGFQLWVNLPKSEKMCTPKYQEFSAQQIPVDNSGQAYSIKVIAGQSDAGVTGPVVNQHSFPLYLDVVMHQSASFKQSIPRNHNAFVYVIDGQLSVADLDVSQGQLAVLGQGDNLELTAQAQSRFLIISGKPMNEPVARHGPFVMNTHDELKQAFIDYQQGRFGYLAEA
jgi:redox-sensitive bicupin YhaK (pirin superfamily)